MTKRKHLEAYQLKQLVCGKTHSTDASEVITTPPCCSCTFDEKAAAIEVTLNIYDVGQDQSVTWINSIFANYYSPVKFGGIFHVGVEIGGQEWSYGYTAEGTGVFSTQPLSQAAHHFNQSVQMPQVTMSQDEVDHLLRELEAEWAGPDYDLLGHNCCHFANDLCERLMIGGIPEWTYRHLPQSLTCFVCGIL